MGRSLVAFAPGSDAAALVAEHGGTALPWTEIVALMKRERLVSGAATPDSDAMQTITVDPSVNAGTIGAAVTAARPGSRIVVKAGEYREPTLRITVPLTIEGSGSVVLDGEGKRGLIVVAADDVTIRGLILRNTGASQVEDRAALRVEGGRNCRIERNRVEDALFGIYLSKTSDCTVSENEVIGNEHSQTVSGNGIHVWQSERATITGNHVRGHRDGIYFEFVKASTVRGNTSEKSDRYGLHFMFSDDCHYETNTFRRNNAGVAVMYSRRVHMTGNRFEQNQGGAAYGLLLKDISDSEIKTNRFVSNSVGLHLEGSNRNQIEGNEFTDNGWALRVLGSAQDNVIAGNSFAGNSFDVGTNSRQSYTTFRENYWDRYRGYDLDHDGYGDVAFPPVRLFALVAEQTPATLILLRSVLVDLLDLAERILPVVTPATMVDTRPRMRPLESHLSPVSPLAAAQP
jgi:nitrous oxidase accessory protein